MAISAISAWLEPGFFTKNVRCGGERRLLLNFLNFMEQEVRIPEKSRLSIDDADKRLTHGFSGAAGELSETARKQKGGVPL